MDEGKKSMKSILIVEDEMILAMNTKFTLEGAGYRVTGIAISGEEALSMVERERPDLVLVDITLNGKMNGIVAAKRMIEELGIPVIYLTGNADDGTLDRAKSTNPAGILQKQTEENKLASIVKKLLGD
jgi:CheY-like chemotaxis protein